ncbi:MAG: hypothetical protein IBJ18_01275 [Phycisphaerales bacterium]|nr:hypothetical protein [Phycisphaerales bacterium]
MKQQNLSIMPIPAALALSLFIHAGLVATAVYFQVFSPDMAPPKRQVVSDQRVMLEQPKPKPKPPANVAGPVRSIPQPAPTLALPSAATPPVSPPPTSAPPPPPPPMVVQVPVDQVQLGKKDSTAAPTPNWLVSETATGPHMGVPSKVDQAGLTRNAGVLGEPTPPSTAASGGIPMTGNPTRSLSDTNPGAPTSQPKPLQNQPLPSDVTKPDAPDLSPSTSVRGTENPSEMPAPAVEGLKNPKNPGKSDDPTPREAVLGVANPVNPAEKATPGEASGLVVIDPSKPAPQPAIPASTDAKKGNENREAKQALGPNAGERPKNPASSPQEAMVLSPKLQEVREQKENLPREAQEAKGGARSGVVDAPGAPALPTAREQPVIKPDANIDAKQQPKGSEASAGQNPSALGTPSPDAKNAPRPRTMAGSPNAEPGEASDRESLASSTRKVEGVFVSRNGKIEVGEGLEVRTERPKLTLLNSLTLAPTPPLMEVVFRKDGTVSNVTVLQSSGSETGIDEPVRSALYRWTASGRILDELPDREESKVVLKVRVYL